MSIQYGFLTVSILLWCHNIELQMTLLPKNFDLFKILPYILNKYECPVEFRPIFPFRENLVESLA